MTTLLEFYDMLERHDWFTHMSDDHRVYLAGDIANAELINVTGESPEHKALWRAWYRHRTRPSNNPKPEKPDE